MLCPIMPAVEWLSPYPESPRSPQRSTFISEEDEGNGSGVECYILDSIVSPVKRSRNKCVRPPVD